MASDKVSSPTTASVSTSNLSSFIHMPPSETNPRLIFTPPPLLCSDEVICLSMPLLSFASGRLSSAPLLFFLLESTQPSFPMEFRSPSAHVVGVATAHSSFSVSGSTVMVGFSFNWFALLDLSRLSTTSALYNSIRVSFSLISSTLSTLLWYSC